MSIAAETEVRRPLGIPWTINSYNLNPREINPIILHPTPYTLNPKPYTLNPKP